MKVKLHQRMAGPHGNHAAGDIIEVDNETATELLNSNQASPVKAAAAETAMEKPAETAELPAKAAVETAEKTLSEPKKGILERLTGMSSAPKKGDKTDK